MGCSGNKFLGCIKLEVGIILSSVLVILVSILLVIVTGLNKNAMIIHLSAISPGVAWVYIVVIGFTIVIEIFGIVAVGIRIDHPRKVIHMKWYRGLFFGLLGILVGGWQVANFTLSFLNQAKTLAACNAASPTKSSTGTTSATPVKSTFLSMQSGQTYGFPSCNEAVTAGIVGNLALLLIGLFYLTYVAIMIIKHTKKAIKEGYEVAKLKADAKVKADITEKAKRQEEADRISEERREAENDYELEVLQRELNAKRLEKALNGKRVDNVKWTQRKPLPPR